jgi:hypothetical protein
MTKFLLSIGLEHDGEIIRELEPAVVTGETEGVFLKKPSGTNLYKWFARIISVSVESIGETKIEYKAKDDIIPSIIKKLPFTDAGGLLIQIHREHWQDIIENQEIRCTECGAHLRADIDLNKIEVPQLDGDVPKFIVVDLDREYVIQTEGQKALEEFDGMQYNQAVFRIPTLGDAMKYDRIHSNIAQFWRNIMFDCLVKLQYSFGDEIVEVPVDYKNRLAKRLFQKIWTTKTLKACRQELMTRYPQTSFYYEDECSQCGAMTKFFARVESFFTL